MTKRSRKWMPLYVDDYLADTLSLTTAQHGAYLLLILHYWKHGSLPTSEFELRQIVKTGTHLWRKNFAPVVSKYFEVDEAGNWRHKRIELEMQRADETSERRSAAGAIGRAKQLRGTRANGRAGPATFTRRATERPEYAAPKGSSKKTPVLDRESMAVSEELTELLKTKKEQ